MGRNHFCSFLSGNNLAMLAVEPSPWNLQYVFDWIHLVQDQQNILSEPRQVSDTIIDINNES